MYKYLQEDNGQSQLKKVKCQRACKFCRKSHTTCEDTRPCQRCIKRDIAQLCLQDETDQLQQQAQQQAQQHAQQQLAAAQAGGSANGTRSTIPAKRREFSHSSYDEEGRVGGPQGGDENRARVSNGEQSFLGAQAGPGPTSASLRSPSPARGTEMMGNVPLPTMMTSSQDSFRPLGSFGDEMQSSPMGQGRQVWYDPSSFGLDKMENAPPQSGQVPSTGPGANSATPEGFSWTALVEGMLETNAQTPGDFSWLNNGSGATPQGNGGNGSQQMSMPVQSQPTPSATGLSANAGNGPSPSNNGRDYRPESSLSPGKAVAADGTVQPFNYTFSYSRLRTFANDLGNPEFKARVSAATDRFKPILHGCLSQYSDEQIVQSEVQFLNYVRQWAIFCDTIPAPACVWRRTGEIYAANSRFMRLLDIPPEVIRKARLTHYQILEPSSFLDYWEDYSSQVLLNLADRTSFDTIVPVAFANRGETRTHLLSSSMHFDSYGLPMAATVVFTPTQASSGSAPPNSSASAQTPTGPSGPSRTAPATTNHLGNSEPTIDVQVGGPPGNPIIRPVPLSSLAYLWMV